MTNKTFIESRRHFLKGATYASVLSLGGLSGLAIAAQNAKTDGLSQVKAATDIADTDISIMQQHTLNGQTVTLINQSDKVVMLNAQQPIALEQFNDSLIVRLNRLESEARNGMIAISPSERISFDIIDAAIFPSKNLDDIQLQITSEHSIFNRIVPVSVA